MEYRNSKAIENLVGKCSSMSKQWFYTACMLDTSLKIQNLICVSALLGFKQVEYIQVKEIRITQYPPTTTMYESGH